MKKILLILVAFVATLGIKAQDVDLGEMQLDTEYKLQDFKSHKGKFVAPKSGVITCSSTTTDDLEPFSDEACTQKLNYTKNSLYGAHSYDLTVEEGKTYYFFTGFIWNSGTVFKITMDELELVLTSSSPELNSIYHIGEGGQISFDFNKAVKFSTSSITIAGTTQRLSGQVFNNSIFFNDIKGIVWDALESGKVKPGDEFTITINGVCMASHNDVLYNGDGVFVAKYTVGDMPIQLIRTENTGNPFLSYYRTGDSQGIVKLTFSGKVNASKLGVQLKYGDIDKDADGDYYVEYLQPTISDDGCSIIVNLQGKRRKAIDMVSSGTYYENVALGVTGVLDEKGHYAYASGSGSLGSYWFSKPFKEISANVVAEFSPGHGSDLSRSKSIEIWITDEDKLSYDGIIFTYTKDGKDGVCEVANSDIVKEVDPDDATAKILTVSVPAELKGATNILLTFKNLQCADGSDYSSLLRAKYNAFIISRSSPVANGTFEFLEEGQAIKVYTNYDSSLDEVTMSLHDLNPKEGDMETLFEGIAKKNADGKGFTLECPSKFRLEMGHEYRLDVTSTEGSDYIIYKGGAEVFRYSDVLLETVSLDTATYVVQPGSNIRVSLTYDGLVKLTAKANGVDLSVMARNADENGYANSWMLSVPAKVVDASRSKLEIELYAIDTNELLVYGNRGYKDTNYHALCYAIAGAGVEGDVNGDEIVDVSDINAVISVICGTTTNAAADVNGDGKVDVSDINAIIAKICGK